MDNENSDCQSSERWLVRVVNADVIDSAYMSNMEIANVNVHSLADMAMKAERIADDINNTVQSLMATVAQSLSDEGGLCHHRFMMKRIMNSGVRFEIDTKDGTEVIDEFSMSGVITAFGSIVRQRRDRSST